MKLAIMQPYFFPYIGYFQLINMIDKFVIYDNIQYTKKGWINRNRFLVNGRDSFFSIDLKKDSDYLNICDRKLAVSFNRKRLINKLRGAYCKAPFYNNIFPVVKNIINYNTDRLFDYILYSLEMICNLLSIDFNKVIISSSIEINHTLKSEDKILAIGDKLNAQQYINPIGGIDLYNEDSFTNVGLELRFLKSNMISYTQFRNEFVPCLSIIDVLMFNSLKEVKEMLNNYEII
jgi:hypothetical protein